MHRSSRSYLPLALTLILAGACSDSASPEQQEEELPDDDSAAVDDEDDEGEDDDDDDDDDGTGSMRDSGGSARADGGRDSGVAPMGDARTSTTPPSGDSGAGARPDSGGSRLDGGAPPANTPALDGDCCPDGNCLCHGEVPTEVSNRAGPFSVEEFDTPSGTVYYPSDADAPFAAIALCGGFLNVGPEMASWGPFYASYGIVTLITLTSAVDIPDIRAALLAASIEELKKQNTTSASPLSGKLAGRYGTSGYSMGGAGTTIASAGDPTLKSSVGLAAWYPLGEGVSTPTLFLCGSSDIVAPCDQSLAAYETVPESTPKMLVTIALADHFSWFGPGDAGGGASGQFALAFQKVFLEGDTRWKPLLLGLSDGEVQTNIQQ